MSIKIRSPLQGGAQLIVEMQQLDSSKAGQFNTNASNDLHQKSFSKVSNVCFQTLLTIKSSRGILMLNVQENGVAALQSPPCSGKTTVVQQVVDLARSDKSMRDVFHVDCGKLGVSDSAQRAS